MTKTALDTAYATMEASPEDAAVRLRFFERLADAELFLLLANEAEGSEITPDIFQTEDASLVLVFDREERLADFAQDGAHYAVLSGRMIAQMLSDQGLGLGLNFGAASAMVLPPDALGWLNETLAQAPAQSEAIPEEFLPPSGLPEAFLTALDTKLSMTAGMASNAYLVGVVYQGGQRGHMLAFVDALPDAQPALAQAVNEALTFSGIEAGSIDVAFLAASDASSASLARVGLRFELPKVETPQPIKAPGSDPNKPPKLR
jgi:hypothetical protein